MIERDFYCPICGSLLFTQVEPVTGELSLTCGNCFSEITAEFKEGIVISTKIEKGKEEND